MWFFTADEHYGHTNIIKHCDRPFDNVKAMNEALIKNHNMHVTENDTVIHAGDFYFGKKEEEAQKYLDRLNGKHIVLKGSHDWWLKDAHEIWENKIEDQYIVVCHYAMRVWPRSHFNSWQLYGHSHGNLHPVGKQWDIGVDNNNYLPVSLSQLQKIMMDRNDNPNLLFPTKHIGSVSGKLYRSLENSLFEAMQSIENDFSYEGKYLIPDIRLDEGKVLILHHMVRVHNYLQNAWLEFSSGIADDVEVPLEVIENTLDFKGSESTDGRKLKRFLLNCFTEKRIPDKRDFEDVFK